MPRTWPGSALSSGWDRRAHPRRPAMAAASLLGARREADAHRPAADLARGSGIASGPRHFPGWVWILRAGGGAGCVSGWGRLGAPDRGGGENRRRRLGWPSAAGLFRPALTPWPGALCWRVDEGGSHGEAQAPPAGSQVGPTPRPRGELGRGSTVTQVRLPDPKVVAFTSAGQHPGTHPRFFIGRLRMVNETRIGFCETRQA